MYDKPPPDIPECGFLDELCPPSVQGKPSLTGNKDNADINYYAVSDKNKIVLGIFLILRL